MMNIDPKDCLYVTDLDGTLLETAGRFSDQSVERLNALLDRGLKFSIATARSYDATHPILSKVNFNLPVILFNGVYLTEFASGHNLQLSKFIERDVIHQILDFTHALRLDPFIYTFGEESRVIYNRITNPGAQKYLDSLENDKRLCSVEHYEFHDEEQIAGCLLIDTHDVLQPVYQNLKERFPEDLNLYFAEDIVNPGYKWLQVFHAKADKGSMLTQLAKRLNIPMSHVVTFGDYLNDLEMFEVAGKSIAVSNGLAQVKEAADQVIGANTEGAVLDYLESLGF